MGFIEVLGNTSPPGSAPSVLADLGLYVRSPSRPRALTLQEARKANEALADILDHIDIAKAQRLRTCTPSFRCNLKRLCAYCGQVREADIARTRRAILSNVRGRAIHLVLTTRGQERLSRYAIEAVFDRFRSFRSLPALRGALPGGIVNVHIKHSDRDGGWLIHLDALIDYAGRLSNNDFKAAWTSLGGGWKIKVQTVEPGTEGRVLRYGASWQKLPPDVGLVRQFLQATPRLTLIRAWGTLHPLHGRRRPGRKGGLQLRGGLAEHTAGGTHEKDAA